MLSLLRRGGLIQFIMAAVVVVIIAAFAFDYRSTQTTGSIQKECVVNLGGDCVLPKDFFSAFRLAVPPYLEAKEIKAQGLRKQVVEGLVERELLLREADRLGISVTDEELDAELFEGKVHFSLPVANHALQMNRSYEVEANPMMTQIPVKSSKSEAFDFKIYKRSVLNYARMSTKDFKNKQRDELIAARMRELIMSGVRIAESEVFTQFERENTKAVARIAHLDNEWFARFLAFPEAAQAAKFSENQDLKASWEDTKSRYTAGCTDLSEIVILYEPDANEKEKAAVKAKLSERKKQLKSGEDFGMAARELSTEPSGANEGRIGCPALGEDEDAKAVADAVAKLKPGQVSEVIATASGVRLVRLNGKLAEADLERVGKEVLARQLSTAEATQQKASEFAEALIEQARGGKGLEEAANELAAKYLANVPSSDKNFRAAALAHPSRPRIEISSGFTLSGNPVPEATSGSPAAIIFALQKSNDVHAEPVSTRGGLAVLQLKEKTQATKEDFDAKKAELMRDMLLRKKADALVAYVGRLRADVGDKLKVDGRYFEETTKDPEDS